MILFRLTYAYIERVHQTTKLPGFSVAITRLPSDATVTARLMTPDVSKMDSHLTYTLTLNHRAALLREMVDTTFQIAQARCMNDYKKLVPFNLRFAEGDVVLAERPLLIASATGPINHEGYSKFLPRRTDRCPAISVRPKCDKSGQDGIRNAVSITKLTSVAKEERLKMKIRPDSKKSTATSLVEESADDEKNSYAVENNVEREDRTMGLCCTVLWNGYESLKSNVEPPLTSLSTSWRHTGNEYKNVYEGTNLQTE